jgi:small subunit ribosomal protein S15
MAVTKAQKENIVKKFQRGNLDTGSSEVQVALLTERINQLTDHFTTHKKDYAGRKGLVTLINQRRNLLGYLKTTDSKKYAKVIGELNLRK